MSSSEGGGDPRYGWVIVAAFSVTVTVSYGVLTYAFGVLLPSIQHDLGWGKTTISGAFSLALLVSSLAGLVVGRLLDRHSPRALMTAGAAAASLLVVAWSRVDSVLGLYLVFTGLGLAMATVLYEPVFTVTTKWFHARRRQALTTITVVAATSSLIFSPLTEHLNAARGWRAALVVLAVILAATVLPLHAVVLRPSPPSGPGERASGLTNRGVFRSRSFLLLTGAFALGSFGTTAIAVHLFSLLQDEGHDAAFAALVVGLLGIAQLPGRLAFGLAGRILGDVGAAVAVFTLGAAALALLALDRSGPVAVAFALAFGASNGMSTLLRATLVGDLYGRDRYGAIFSVTAAASNTARAAGPIGAASVLLLPGGYTTLLWVLVALLGAGGLAISIAIRGRSPLAEIRSVA